MINSEPALEKRTPVFFVMLETERLSLKLYSAAEKNEFVALMTDEMVMKHVDLGVFSKEKAENLWRKLHKEFYPQGKKTIYAVFAKDDDRYIGHAALRPRPEKPLDWEISYILKKEEWGKGLATEIACGLINFGFTVKKLTEVFATIDDDNWPSIKVAQKAGMSFSHYEYDEQGRFSVYAIKDTSLVE